METSLSGTDVHAEPSVCHVIVPPPTRAHLSSRLAFWLVGYSVFLMLMGSTLPAPLYTLYQQRWHFSAAMITTIFALYPAGVILTLLVAGCISDQVGRRRILVLAATLVLLSAFGFIFAQNVAWLLGARFLLGVGVALCSSTATAALTELRQPQDTRYAALINSACTSLGFCVGSLIAGGLAQYAPWPTALVFIIYSVFLSVAVVGLWFMPEPLPRPTTAVLWRWPRMTIPATSAFLGGGWRSG